MKKAILILISFSFLYSSLWAYSSNPRDFISELVNDSIKTLSDKDLNKEEKSLYIEKIALDNVDINALGLYTLGDIRKTLNEQDVAKYQNVFRSYFLKSLTSRLSDYSSSRFEIIGDDKKSSNYTIVNSKVLPDNGPEIKIDWRVYTKNPEKPLIRDLIVEGLSLARTQKEEFKSIMQNNNDDINFLFKSFEEFLIK